MNAAAISITGIQDVSIEGERLYRFEQSMKHFLQSLIGSDGKSFKDIIIELRYTVGPRRAVRRDHLHVDISFIVRCQDPELLIEVTDLLELCLFDGGLEYSREVDFPAVAVPYSPLDATFFARRLSRSRPIEVVPFDPKREPDASRLCNILLRQRIPCSLHVIARPCNFMPSDQVTLEHLWGKEGFATASPESTLDDPIRLAKIPPFLMNVRLLSSAPIKSYLANAIGSEIAGGYSFVTWKKDGATVNEMKSWFQNGTICSVELPVRDSSSLPQVVTEAYNTYFEQELLRAFRLPDKSLPGYQQKYYSRLPASVDSLASNGVLLGYGSTSSTREEVPIFLSTQDRRRHLYVLGQTGTGKSTFLLNLILQDLHAGHGGCIIDPHGDLILDILGNVDDSVIKQGRLVLFDPSDETYKPGLNLLETGPSSTEQEREYIVNELVAVFLRLFDEEIFGPRIQHYFRNACITLMESNYPGTLVDVPRLFTNDSFRMHVLSTVNNAFVKEFWIEEFAKTGVTERREMIPYFNAKFGPIVGSYLIRYIIGQHRSTFDVKKILSEGKTLLVPLAKGLIGGINASLLGSFMVNKVVGSMFARAKIPEDERKDFYLYVDEFQNFVSQAFGEVLSEARKYKVSLTISHQYIDQLSVMGKASVGSAVKQAVFGNVGNSIFFRIGTGDVEDVGKILYGVPRDFASTMVNMENYVAIAKILSSGQPVTPFTIRTPSVHLPLGAADDPRRILAEARRRKLLKKFGSLVDSVRPIVDSPGEW